MVKLIPVLGSIVLIGAIVQVALGFSIAGGTVSYTGSHILLGIVGLLLVIGLAIIAFKTPTATIYSKIIMTVLTIIVLIQVGMGFQLLQGARGLAAAHEGIGFIIILLTIIAGMITAMSARRRARTAAITGQAQA